MKRKRIEGGDVARQQQQKSMTKKQMTEIIKPPSPKITTKTILNESESIKYLMNIKSNTYINDITKLKNILTETFDERRLLINLSKNLYEDFPYLFTSTNIVRFFCAIYVNACDIFLLTFVFLRVID